MNSLKRLRATSGKSLRELSKNSGVDQATISMVENDKRKAHLSTLSKLAVALGVQVDDLLDLVDTGAVERGHKGGLASMEKAKKEERAA